MASTTSFTAVTEISGDPVSEEQVARAYQRYRWAQSFCRGKDVLEVACGSGFGLGLLADVARSVRACDIDPMLVATARLAAPPGVLLEEGDAERLQVGDLSVDVVVLFEAIYYVPKAERFLAEVKRVLRPGGVLLMAMANKDLADFNPSPLTHRYFNAPELDSMLEPLGFTCQFFGSWPVSKAGSRERLLRPLKRAAVDLGLVPKTMVGKRLLKRLVFGKLVEMPRDLREVAVRYAEPRPLAAGQPNREFKVLFVSAVRS